MKKKQSNTQCPCPYEKEMSEEERINSMVDSFCLHYKAMLGEFNNMFEDSKEREINYINLRNKIIKDFVEQLCNLK